MNQLLKKSQQQLLPCAGCVSTHTNQTPTLLSFFNFELDSLQDLVVILLSNPNPTLHLACTLLLLLLFLSFISSSFLEESLYYWMHLFTVFTLLNIYDSSTISIMYNVIQTQVHPHKTSNSYFPFIINKTSTNPPLFLSTTNLTNIYHSSRFFEVVFIILEFSPSQLCFAPRFFLSCSKEGPLFISFFRKG